MDAPTMKGGILMQIDSKDLERAIEKVVQSKHHKRKKREFSKCIMLFLSIICGATWIAATVAWFLWREFPTELVEYTQWFFVAAAAYMVKSGYENRAKIMRQREGDD